MRFLGPWIISWRGNSDFLSSCAWSRNSPVSWSTAGSCSIFRQKNGSISSSNAWWSKHFWTVLKTLMYDVRNVQLVDTLTLKENMDRWSNKSHWSKLRKMWVTEKSNDSLNMPWGREEQRSEGEKEKSSTRTDTESHSRTGSLRWRHPSFLSAHWSPTLDTIQSHITSHMWQVLPWIVPCILVCVVDMELYSRLRVAHGNVFSKTAASIQDSTWSHWGCNLLREEWIFSHLLLLISVLVIIKNWSPGGVYFIYPCGLFFW